jgi:hypothetical protein
MKVRCKKNRFQGVRHALTINAVYEVLGIECDSYRIIDDLGEPFLFDAPMFTIVDQSRPTSWITESLDGHEYSYPRPFGKPGFWEDYHDGVPAARRAFSRFLNKHLRLRHAA